MAKRVFVFGWTNAFYKFFRLPMGASTAVIKNYKTVLAGS